MHSIGEDAMTALETATIMTEAICELPAVATLDWGDRAAEALRPVAVSGRVCLLLASIDQSGAIVSHEATGVATGRRDMPGTADPSVELTLRSRAERLTDIGFRPSAAELDEGVFGSLGELIRSPDWRTRGLGQLWAGIPCTDVLVGACRMGTVEAGRLMIAQVAYTSAEGPGGAAAKVGVSLLRVSMPLLVRRALLAIGARRSTSARWLTVREQQVLHELTLGKSVRQIAEEMGRSCHTVHDHVKSLHRKLNASSRGELVSRALGHIDEATRIRDTRRPGAEATPEVRTRDTAAFGMGRPATDATPRLGLAGEGYEGARATAM